MNEKNRSDLLTQTKQKKQKENEEKEKLFLISTYREGYQYTNKIVKKNWDVLARSSTTKHFHRADLMMGYRKPRDLRSFLVKAKTDYNTNDQKETNIETIKCADSSNKCTKKDCKYCKLLDRSGIVQKEGRKFSSKRDVTCNSSNVIYCIECTRCNKRYVGQTKRKIKDRLREHIYGIKNQKDTDVSYHFNTNGHCGAKDMKVHIMDFVYMHPESEKAKKLRHLIEINWIQRLSTMAPNGMNIMDNRYG